MKKEEKKLTLEEYQEKYCKVDNSKLAKKLLFIIVAGVGILIAAMLALLVLRFFDVNEYAGYGSLGVAVLVFFFLYLVPVFQIGKQKSFITNVNNASAKKAQKYNKKMREDIADKMIDLVDKTEEVTWYSEDAVGKLAIARHQDNNDALKNALTNIYNTDVKKAANKMIRDAAMKVGVTTALSQSDKLDTMFVCVFELNLIKQLVYLYGFRPSDAKLLRIYETVIVNSLMAYGLGSATSSIATGVVGKMGKIASSIPLLGSAIGIAIDSASQGLINSAMTVILGFQVKKYLMKEYKLQDILDTVIVTDEELIAEQDQILADVKGEVEKTKKRKDKDLQTA